MRKSDSVVKQQKASSHLSGLEIVLNQMVTIDRSRTMEELNRAIQGILEYIGEYTKAGRAYTFEFIENRVFTATPVSGARKASNPRWTIFRLFRLWRCHIGTDSSCVERKW